MERDAFLPTGKRGSLMGISVDGSNTNVPIPTYCVLPATGNN